MKKTSTNKAGQESLVIKREEQGMGGWGRYFQQYTLRMPFFFIFNAKVVKLSVQEHVTQ
jgi:hypothetical protein